MRSLSSTLPAFGLAALIVASPAPAAGRGGLMGFDHDFCAARTYDAAHLKSHPGQTVTHLWLGARGGWNVAEGRDLPNLDAIVALSVMAGGTVSGPVLLACTDFAEDQKSPVPGAFYCQSRCGRGQIVVTVRGDELTLRSDGFTAQCGLPSLQGPGDRVFVLRTAASGACAIPKDWPGDEVGIKEVWGRME